MSGLEGQVFQFEKDNIVWESYFPQDLTVETGKVSLHSVF